MTGRIARLVSALALLTMLGSAPMARAELNQAAVAFKLPDKIDWKSNPNNAGVQSAVMVGDPTKPGLYMVLTRWLPGNMSRPHWHPQ